MHTASTKGDKATGAAGPKGQMPMRKPPRLRRCCSSQLSAPRAAGVELAVAAAAAAAAAVSATCYEAMPVERPRHMAHRRPAEALNGAGHLLAKW